MKTPTTNTNLIPRSSIPAAGVPRQAGHSDACDVNVTGRYTLGCAGCLADANNAREIIDDLDRKAELAREARRPARRKTKREMAIERATELIAHLEENAGDAMKDGNEAWQADLGIFLSALYAADVPAKDGTLRIELDLVADDSPARRQPFTTPARRTAGFFEARRTR